MNPDHNPILTASKTIDRFVPQTPAQPGLDLVTDIYYPGSKENRFPEVGTAKTLTGWTRFVNR
jgi:hypothetical protein